MEKNGNPAVMKFEKGMTSAGNIDNWTRIKGAELPDGKILVWPPRTLSAEYTRHKFKTSSFQRLFNHLADSGFEPKWIDGYSVANKGYLNFSWKPASGKKWEAYFGLKASSYQNAMDNRGNLSPTFVDTYTINGEVRYNLILKKVSGGFIARHGLTYDKHKSVMETAKEKGLEPVNISVVSINNQRQYTVLYRNKNYNGWKIRSKTKETDYQQLFNDNKSKGYSPVYINAYKHKGEVYLSAIFAKKGGGTLSAIHGASATKIQSSWQSAVNNGYSTKMITSFDGASSNHRFAALWRK